MRSSSPKKKSSSNQAVILLVFFGFLVVFFAFGKSIVDVIVLPRTLDLAADDQLEAGFLPVYAEEGSEADPNLVALQDQPLAQPFPTPQPDTQNIQPTLDPGLAPDRIAIPKIELDSNIIPVESEPLSFEGEIYEQWLAPDYRAVGWHYTSVGLGVPGNTVLNGHHNIKGEVFRDLYQLQTGDEIDLFSGDKEFRYIVVYTAVLPERNQPLEVRLANAEWIQATEDERITLITCWPYESNTHRVVVVAVPMRTTASVR
jgi:LPXTG-site transpeptidase (sortase) family protein